MKKALITGAFGNDGKYLISLLNKLGNYKIVKYTGCLTRSDLLSELIRIERPDEIYHFGGMSIPSKCDSCLDSQVMQVNFMPLTVIGDTIQMYSENTKLFFAGSSAMYGNTNDLFIDERTDVCMPENIYGLSKYFGYKYIKQLRKKGVFACTGIMYNHYGVYSKDSLVIKQLIKGVINYQRYGQPMKVGNLGTVVDFGASEDYVAAAHLILQQDQPDDYIINSSKRYMIDSILDYITQRLNCYKIEMKVDNKLFKPFNEKGPIATNAKLLGIGWKPTKTILNVIDEMIFYEQTNRGI